MPCSCLPGAIDLKLAQHAGSAEPCENPQVMAVSRSALSGFRLRPPDCAIQEDSLKRKVFALVSVTVSALELRSRASRESRLVAGVAGGTSQDDLSVLTGAGGGFGDYLHGREGAGVGGRPHLDGGVA